MRSPLGTPETALPTAPRVVSSPIAGLRKQHLGVATASGHHGELLQGPVRLRESVETALVTLPDHRWVSQVDGRVTPHTELVVTSVPHKPKVVAAVISAMDMLGINGARIELSITGSTPVSRGLGSSTTDMTSALHCVDQALGLRISAHDIARICHQVEGATDPTMFPDSERLLFASRRSATLKRFSGELPDFMVASFDASEMMGSIDTAKVVFNYSEHQVQRFDGAVRNYEKALKTKDLKLLKAAATESARINQDFLPIPQWRILARVLERHDLGLQIAHTGSVLGLIAHPAQHVALERASREVCDLTGFVPTGLVRR